MDLIAEELSVGNYIKSNLTGEVVKVDWINLKHIVDGNCQCPPYDLSKVYSPILLSEEMILKLGGIKGENEDTYWLPNRFGIWFEKAGVISDMDGWYWGDSFIQMQYVHELQNLYTLITKKQLTINESTQ